MVNFASDIYSGVDSILGAALLRSELESRPGKMSLSTLARARQMTELGGYELDNRIDPNEFYSQLAAEALKRKSQAPFHLTIPGYGDLVCCAEDDVHADWPK